MATDTKKICRHCPKCKQYGELEYKGQTEFYCPQCGEKWGEVKNQKNFFDYCPMCPARQFYLSKNFNQFVGCLIMGIGIVLVPWTYGLSLPVFALVDWLLHKRTANLINCYRCGTSFAGFTEEEKRFKPFLHHIGLKYDKYR